MKPLPLQYNKNGYTHKQLFREADIAIYETISDGKIIGYEVFEVLISKARIWGDVVFSQAEMTPTNEQWGINGFTVSSKTAAFEKLTHIRELIDRRKQKLPQTLETILKP